MVSTILSLLSFFYSWGACDEVLLQQLQRDKVFLLQQLQIEKVIYDDPGLFMEDPGGLSFLINLREQQGNGPVMMVDSYLLPSLMDSGRAVGIFCPRKFIYLRSLNTCEFRNLKISKDKQLFRVDIGNARLVFDFEGFLIR